MSKHPRHRLPVGRYRPLATMAIAALILTACGQTTDEIESSGSPSPPSRAESELEIAPPDQAEATEPAADGSAPAQAPRPTAVRIPAIEVDASMIPLDLRTDGSIDVPSDPMQTGWWVDGPEPGEQGPAVILGHVDSRHGPAVFFRLAELDPGDQIHVDREDGSTVTFEVQRLEQHPKTEFPTHAVYGPTERPVLRLVTCGGDFNQGERSYLDNVIVFASEVT